MPTCERGYTYIVVLVLLAVLSLAAALTLQVAQTNAQRSGESELLAMGREFERAFASYYRQSPVGARRFPERLEDLTRDPRVLGVRRHLRRVYADPLSGQPWGTIPAPGGGIMGVYSTAPGSPYREDVASTLPAPSAASGSSGGYAEWRFGYDPAIETGRRMPIVKPTPMPPMPPAPASGASGWR